MKNKHCWSFIACPCLWTLLKSGIPSKTQSAYLRWTLLSPCSCLIASSYLTGHTHPRIDSLLPHCQFHSTPFQPWIPSDQRTPPLAVSSRKSPVALRTPVHKNSQPQSVPCHPEPLHPAFGALAVCIPLAGGNIDAIGWGCNTNRQKSSASSFTSTGFLSRSLCCSWISSILLKPPSEASRSILISCYFKAEEFASLLTFEGSWSSQSCCYPSTVLSSPGCQVPWFHPPNFSLDLKSQVSYFFQALKCWRFCSRPVWALLSIDAPQEMGFWWFDCNSGQRNPGSAECA